MCITDVKSRQGPACLLACSGAARHSRTASPCVCVCVSPAAVPASPTAALQLKALCVRVEQICVGLSCHRCFQGRATPGAPCSFDVCVAEAWCSDCPCRFEVHTLMYVPHVHQLPLSVGGIAPQSPGTALPPGCEPGVPLPLAAPAPPAAKGCTSPVSSSSSTSVSPASGAMSSGLPTTH